MNKRKKVFLLAGMALAGATAVQAQEAAGLYLDAYTVPVDQKNALIGRIFGKNGQPAEAKLLKDASGLFTVSGSELKLKKKSSVGKDGKTTFPVSIAAGSDTADFLLVKDQFIKNKVIAHRGAWKHHEGSQNSITSLKDAIRLGCEGSEFDVWLSSDNQLVISHDPEIGGKKVEESTMADLQAVQLKNGDHVPSLEEYIDVIMTQGSTRLVLELKPSGKGKGQLLATKAMALVRAKKAQAWMFYISFDYNICKKLKELDPAAKIAYLNGDKTPEQLKADGIWGLDYHQQVFKQQPQLIAISRQQGITTNAWTVDAPEIMDVLLKDGVDYITTNEPEILLEKVRQTK
ncbi:glycerophosphodiester phosphodiesterase family protein [Chitinophaga sp. 212800010-3]|uniref:glycerophosphodiester phosphodiesterase family protein n=1 Tax=unclassified Chitinophaga TaxID=2619133 RepID=UPI002DF70944|nr:GP-PDE domain-containing protein [Chitinophaga sp. 212800010-3]